jgi:hypothetical protein
VILTALQSETTTQLSSSHNPSYPGQTVTLTASVSTRTAPVTTGMVNFMQGSTVLATVGVDSSGTASFSTTSLPLGTTTITAVYLGTTDNLGSTSPAVTQTVVPYTTTTIVASTANPILPGQVVTLTATVRTNETGTPVTTGTVSFLRGQRLLGVVPLASDGTARLTFTLLKAGKGRIQAVYNGTADDVSSASKQLLQRAVRFPTTTSVGLSKLIQSNGSSRYLLQVNVATAGTPAVIPYGTVVFRRNGRSFRRVNLTDGTAEVVIHGRVRRSTTFVAVFQQNSVFQKSTSPPVKRQV